jgi:LuxR family maltose regulon positive regulatory protein
LLDISRLLGALGRPGEAAALARSLVEAARLRGRTHGALQGAVILAKALALEGRRAEALPILTEAVRLASPEGYLTTFVDEGEIIRSLLVEIHSRLPARDPAWPAYERLLAGFPAGTGPLEPAAREPAAPLLLSEREREVLQLMQAGLTNQEIAGQLFISITTVKTHAGNIFNKLGVSNRLQAIARGEALGLLPTR